MSVFTVPKLEDDEFDDSKKEKSIKGESEKELTLWEVAKVSKV